jgi:DNA mismatch repair protein MutH
LHYSREFDPTTAHEAQIIAHAYRLRGKRLGDVLPSTRQVRERSPRDKGAVGQLVERFFGIRQNSDSAPDFAGAGIELKVVPLKMSRGRARTKERTVISMIDYQRLALETWQSASVRFKIDRILFVFYEHVSASAADDAKIVDFVLWSPGEDLRPQLEQDWSVVQRKAYDGRAHEISERDGRVLGAATKGSHGTKRVRQYREGAPPAKPRAWALKPGLTTFVFDSRVLGKQSVSLSDSLLLTPGQAFEQAVLTRLHALRGRRIDDVARELGVSISRAKSGLAILVRRALGVYDDRARIKEFEHFGVEIKTAPVSADGKPYESMSFPRIDHMDIVHDDWDDSDLRSRLERLLIVPVIRDYKTQPKEEHVLGRAFFWSPTSEDISAIQAEWERFVDVIRLGQADRLPTAASTGYIHLRPKGRDGRDVEEAPGGLRVVKRCFWLNSDYVRRIIADSGGPL